MFGGFGGCGLIPNTLLNGTSGGEGYASSFSYSGFLALFVVVFAPIIGKIPMASLAGKNKNKYKNRSTNMCMSWSYVNDREYEYCNEENEK